LYIAQRLRLPLRKLARYILCSGKYDKSVAVVMSSAQLTVPASKLRHAGTSTCHLSNLHT